MKKILLVLFALISLNAFSQLQVKEGSFKYVPGGVIEDKAEYTDGNDLPMALIKISTENISEQERMRLVFTGNRATQIIKKPKTGAMWIYISADAATFIDIRHPDYGTYKYLLPEKLCDYCVYEMVLQYNAYLGPDSNKPRNNAVTITADQDNALIYIDDNFEGEKEISKFLPIGSTHSWRIECDLYHTETGSFTISEEDGGTVIEKQLRPAYGFLNVTSQPESGAMVFVNNMKVGQTPYRSGRMPSGTYDVKVVKEMYGTKEQKFAVADGQTTEAVINMDAKFVNATITTDALSEIYVDEVYVDKGSWMGRLVEGKHLIEARKEKYRTSYKEVYVELGKNVTITIDAPQPICGFLEITSNPLRADVYIDDVHYGQTPKIISSLIIGEHKLRLSKQGCADLIKTIQIEEGETLSLNEKLHTGKEIKINTGQKGDKVYLDGNYIGISPITTKLSYGKHDIKAERGTQVVNESIDVTNTSALSYNLSFEKEPLKGYLKRGINFITLNAACSAAPQTSFGFTYGRVKNVGWFISAMSDFGFRFSADDWNDLYSMAGVVDFSGESSNTRLSVTGGFVARLFGPIYVKLGAGYGARVKCWEVAGKWYEYTPDTYKGFDLTAGVMVNTRKYAISADVVTTNFKTMEIKLGVGLNWNK